MSMNAAPAVEAADPLPEAQRRVLIVDDDRDFADGLASALELIGCTVEAVYDAEGAVERGRAFAPAIAIVDIHLGAASGLDLAARLRSDWPDLLCIMMTAYAEIGTAIEAVREGAYDYLRKPLHDGELLAALDRGFEVLRLRREKAAAEETAEQEHVRLIEAIESISEGFILYDADERFVLCNSRYKDFYPQIADDLVPGAKLEDVARMGFERGAVLEAVGNVEEWMRIRVGQHRSASGSHEQHLSDGRWLLCSERKTRDGQTVGIRTDITELKRREHEMRGGEERYAGLFENSPVGIWEEDFSGVKTYLDELPDDRTGDFEAYLDLHPEVVEECVKRVRIVDVNQAGLRLLDAPDKDAFLAGLPLVFTAEAYDRFKHELVEIRNGVTSFEHETLVRTLAGDVRNFAVRWTVAPGAEQTYARVFLTTIDITDQKRTEEALRKSEAQYRAVVESQTEFITRMTPDGTRTFINDAYCRFLGKERDDLIGISVYPDLHPDDIERSNRHFASAFSDNKITQIEVRAIRGDGAARWIQWNETAVLGEDGTVLELQGVGRDVTNRKSAEDALRLSEASLANAQRIARLGNWDWDVVADELQWSDEIYRIFGVRPREFGATHLAFLDCVHPDDRDRVRRTIEEALDNRRSYDLDYTILRSDGESRIVHEHAEASLDGGGQIVRMSGTVQDVTEGRQAEYALRESERRLRAIIDNAPNVILLKDEHGRYLTVNKEFQRLYGVTVDEALGKLPHEIALTAEVARVSREHDEAVLKAGEAIEIEERVPLADGDHIFRTVKFPIPGELGGIGGIGSIEIDITERKVAEEALRESEERFRAVFEQAAVGIGLMTPGGRFLSVNDKLCDIMHRERHEMMAIRFHEFTHPDDYRTCVELIAKLVSGGITTFTTEMRYLRKDGELLWGNLTVSIIRQPDSDRFALLGVVEDITERKRAEAELRESDERFRSFVDNLPSAIFLKDMEGRYRIVNKRFEEWYGISAAEAAGRTAHDIYAKKFADLYVALDREVMETGEVREQELTVPFADGGLRVVIVTKFPVLGTDGQTIGVGTIDTDITGQRRVEAQLQQAQKMEAVGQLTGGVAHDFNNLLTVILGNIALLEDEIEDERLGLFALAAKGAAERGAELTDQLLTFSRKQTLDAKPVDLGELVSGMSRILRRTLGDNIQIETTTAGDLSRTRADPAQLENALLNLAINARDAMPDGGKLNIEAANASADRNDLIDYPAAAPEDFVVLSVSDNGSGMEPGVLERVFEPFFTTKEVGEGSGLGLSMVYGFVKQSGGHVEIDSEPGRGTSVRVFLPKAPESDAVAEKVTLEEPEPRGQGETVLVVEDDAAVRRLTVNILTSLGYRTVEAGAGEAALAALDDRPEIDLLLSDFMLPGGMNGAELVREATLRRPGLKVLLMSGYAAARPAREPGLDSDAEMIRKPYQKPALARHLRTLLEG
jgi:PAS domain S-box-containing protein